MDRATSEMRTTAGAGRDRRAGDPRSGREFSPPPASGSARLATWLRGTLGRQGLRTYRVRLLVQGGCVASCPHGQVLTVGTRRRRVGVLAFAAGILLVLAAGYVAARASGAWQNGIGREEYTRRIVEIDEAIYSHPGR